MSNYCWSDPMPIKHLYCYTHYQNSRIKLVGFVLFSNSSCQNCCRKTNWSLHLCWLAAVTICSYPFLENISPALEQHKLPNSQVWLATNYSLDFSALLPSAASDTTHSLCHIFPKFSQEGNSLPFTIPLHLSCYRQKHLIFHTPLLCPQPLLDLSGNLVM